jgi:hypothetical protein
MGLFSRFYVHALRFAAHSVSKTRVNALAEGQAAPGTHEIVPTAEKICHQERARSGLPPFLAHLLHPLA